MGRNRDTNLKMKEERRERILSGALELFAINGFSGTRVGDIAKRTSMSNGLIYHYFPSKDDIFTELIRVAFERLIKACKILEEMNLPPHEKIRFALEELVNTIRNSPESGLYHLLVAQATAAKPVPGGVKEILKKNRKIPFETVSKIISQGQLLHTIRQGDADEYAFFFWNNINGIALHQVMYGKSAKSPSLVPLYHMFFEQWEENKK